MALHLPVPIPAQPLAAAPSAAVLLSEEAASEVVGTTHKTLNTVGPGWAGVEVYDTGTNFQEEVGGDATQAVRATWTVPYAVPNGYQGYAIATNWVGIGGGYLSVGPAPSYAPSNLVQIGTQEQEYNGRINYSAWYEVVGGPKDTGGPVPIPVFISPGDQMLAQITPLGKSTYNLELVDLTKLSYGGIFVLTSFYFTTVAGETGVVTPGATRTSAEMVTIEAPNLGQYALPLLTPVIANAYLSTSANTFVAFGGVPGFEIDDIISNDPTNTLGKRTLTLASPTPGDSYIFTLWLDAT